MLCPKRRDLQFCTRTCSGFCDRVSRRVSHQSLLHRCDDSRELGCKEDDSSVARQWFVGDQLCALQDPARAGLGRLCLLCPQHEVRVGRVCCEDRVTPRCHGARRRGKEQGARAPCSSCSRKGSFYACFTHMASRQSQMAIGHGTLAHTGGQVQNRVGHRRLLRG